MVNRRGRKPVVRDVKARQTGERLRRPRDALREPISSRVLCPAQGVRAAAEGRAEWKGCEVVVREVQRRQVRKGPEVDWQRRELVVRQVDRRQRGEVCEGVWQSLHFIVVQLEITQD